MNDPHHPDTGVIRDQMERTQYREHSAPIFLTSSFVFESAEQMEAMFNGSEDGDIYSRYANPNTTELISKMCHLEGAEAGFATASGMAAVWSSMAGILRSGDHLIANEAVFGSTHQLLTQMLPRFGISHTYADFSSPEHVLAAIQTNTKMIFVESPSNPGLRLIDLEMVGKIARDRDLILNVDNCFSTPLIQNPIRYGANLVTHSATKYIDGQGRTLGGLVLGDQELIDQVALFCRHTGPAMSPFNAWILSKSLETLPLRMERHCNNAQTVASYLESHPKVTSVNYPFLRSHPQHELARKQMVMGGGIVSFDITGGKEGAQKFLNGIRLCSLSSNLGDSRTILTHPTTTTHAKLTAEERLSVGIPDGLIRISVGLENIAEIVADLDHAFLSL